MVKLAFEIISEKVEKSIFEFEGCVERHTNLLHKEIKGIMMIRINQD